MTLPRLATAFALFAACCLPAQGGAAEPLVEGNRWTATGYAEDLARRCIDRGDDEPEALSQCLMDSRLFSEVSIAGEGDGPRITVEDRWPILPIPYTRTQGDSTVYGLFLVHANFLGRGKVAVVGGLWGDTTNYYLSYLDPSILLTDWSGRIDLRRRSEEIRAYDHGGALDGFSVDELSATIKAGGKIARDLELQWALWYRDRDHSPLEGSASALHDYAALATGFEATWDRSHFRLYYQEGAKVFLRARHDVLRNDDEELASNIRLVVDWQGPLVGPSVLKVNGMAVAIDDWEPFTGGGKIGLRGVQSNGVWFKTMATIGIDWHLPVLTIPLGTVTVGPFLDAATFQAMDGRWDDTVAWGASANLYLKTVALPGVGITVGSNERFSGGTFVSFQLGYDF